MPNDPITLTGLRLLCDLYVPRVARHAVSLWPHAGDWWPAHEIGHLLTAIEPWRRKAPLFGFDLPDEPKSKQVHEAYCRELAAMSISRRVHTSMDRHDLVCAECESTDSQILTWKDNGRVRQILQQADCVYLPRTLSGLERKLQHTVAP